MPNRETDHERRMRERMERIEAYRERMQNRSPNGQNVPNESTPTPTPSSGYTIRDVRNAFGTLAHSTERMNASLRDIQWSTISLSPSSLIGRQVTINGLPYSVDTSGNMRLDPATPTPTPTPTTEGPSEATPTTATPTTEGPSEATPTTATPTREGGSQATPTSMTLAEREENEAYRLLRQHVENYQQEIRITDPPPVARPITPNVEMPVSPNDARYWYFDRQLFTSPQSGRTIASANRPTLTREGIVQAIAAAEAPEPILPTPTYPAPATPLVGENFDFAWRDEDFEDTPMPAFDRHLTGRFRVTEARLATPEEAANILLSRERAITDAPPSPSPTRPDGSPLTWADRIQGEWANSGEWPEDVEIDPQNPLTNPATSANMNTSENDGAPEQRRSGTSGGTAIMIQISQAARLLGVDRQRLHYLREAGELRAEARPTITGTGVRYFVDIDEARNACERCNTWVQRTRRPQVAPITAPAPTTGAFMQVDRFGDPIPAIVPAALPANYTPVGIRNANRKFGVEMEVMLTSTYDLIAKMREQGLECDYEGYNHQARPHWKIVTDGSLSSHLSGYQGYEIVSPPLSGEDGMLQVKKACRALKAVNAKVNKTCGMHVHHEVADLTNVEAFKRLIRNYRESIRPIETILAPSRRHDTSGRTSYCAVWTTSEMRSIDACRSVSDLHRAVGRYYVINLQAMPRQGTVEFRQHHGTIDSEKVIQWIKFGQSMIDEAAAGATIAATDLDQLATALAFGAMQKDFWQSRNTELTTPRVRRSATRRSA